MQRYLVDVFTAEPGKGNPAAVILGGAGLSGAEMGGLAAQLGLETAFVDGTTLRYYQPSGVAMTLCGHGTLAALAVLRGGEVGSVHHLHPGGRSGGLHRALPAWHGDATGHLCRPGGTGDCGQRAWHRAGRH